MELEFRQTRQELELAIDGELGPIYDEFTELYWELSEVIGKMSALVARTAQSRHTLMRLTREVAPPQLPLEDQGEDGDH